MEKVETQTSPKEQDTTPILSGLTIQHHPDSIHGEDDGSGGDDNEGEDLPEPQLSPDNGHPVPMEEVVVHADFNCPVCDSRTEVKLYSPLLENEQFRTPCCDVKFNINPEVTPGTVGAYIPLESLSLPRHIAFVYLHDLIHAEHKKGVLNPMQKHTKSLTAEHVNTVLERQANALEFINSVETGTSVLSPPTREEQSLSRIHNILLYVPISVLCISSYPVLTLVGVNEQISVLFAISLLLGTLIHDYWVVNKEVTDFDGELTTADVVQHPPKKIEPRSVKLFCEMVGTVRERVLARFLTKT